MKPTEALQDALYKEMLARIKETDLSVPYQGRRVLLLLAHRGGQAVPDPLPQEGQPGRAGGGHPRPERRSPRGRSSSRSARSLSATTAAPRLLDRRHRLPRLHAVRQGPLRRGAGALQGRRRPAPWPGPPTTRRSSTRSRTPPSGRTGSTATISVGREDDARPRRGDELFRIGVGRTRSREYLLLGIGSHTTTEWRFLPAATPAGAFRMVAPREHEHEYDVDHHGDSFYIRTNDRGRNFRLVKAPVDEPGRESWREVVPAPARRDAGGHRLLPGSLRAARARARAASSCASPTCAPARRTASTFPEPAYSVFPVAQRRVRHHAAPLQLPVAGDAAARSSTTTWTRGSATLLKQQPVLGGYDPRAVPGPSAWMALGAGRHAGADLDRLPARARARRPAVRPSCTRTAPTASRCR